MRTKQKLGLARNVDEYIESAPENTRRVLKDLRKAIKEAAPKAEETISYQIPAYKYRGPVVFFAAFEKHLSLYVPGGSTLKKFRSRLKPNEISGATVHFTAENPLPASLVKEMVRTRMKENELRAKLKK
jgi:uncharacterized protein YdhG (YjbR/CyaY superfamily)